MRIVFGVRTFGRVDATDGFRVVTRFFHFSYLPLFPIGGESILLFPNTDDGVRIPMSGKSVLFAYLRGALAVGTVVSIIDALSSGASSGPIYAVLCALAFGLSYPLSRPSAARKQALLSQLSGGPP